MTSFCTLPARPILCAGMLYLALPFFLFAAGWLQPVFSIPVCLAAAFGVVSACRAMPAGVVPLSRRAVAGTALLTAVCFLLAFLCGFTGHVPQHGDFFIRNAIYAELSAHAWPLVLPDGHHFIYYLGHWLPSSLAAQYCPPWLAPWLLTCWTFLGLALALLAAICRWGVRTATWWAILLLGMGSVANTLNSLDSLGAIALLPPHNAQMTLIINIPAQLFSTFNHAVPALLAATLVLTRSLSPAGGFLAGAFLLLCSPLAGIALLPYLIHEALASPRPPGTGPAQKLRALLLQPAFLAALPPVLVLAAFYSHLEGGGAFTCLFGADYAAGYNYEKLQLILYPGSIKYASFLISLALGILLPALLLFPACKRLPLYYITLAGMACCLFFRTGIMNNELLFKSPAVFYPFLAFLFLHAFRQGRPPYRILLATFILTAAIPSVLAVAEKLQHFSTDPAVMQSHRRESYGGSLYHPEHPTYRQFIKQEGHPLPAWLFKTKTAPEP